VELLYVLLLTIVPRKASGGCFTRLKKENENPQKNIRTDFSFLRMADDDETSWRITPAIGTGIGLGTRF
jgi:hypothetical protein